jgi:Flp pilus assembly pilin Flp
MLSEVRSAGAGRRAVKESSRECARTLLGDTRGSNTVEYIIIVGVVALLSIPAFTEFGSTVSKTVEDQGKLVDNALPKMGF